MTVIGRIISYCSERNSLRELKTNVCWVIIPFYLFVLAWEQKDDK